MRRAQTPTARTDEVWHALAACLHARLDGSTSLSAAPGQRARASLWAFSQVLHGAVLLDQVLHDGESRAVGLGHGLEAYRRGAAYATGPRPRPGARYYDDNAWVALAVCQTRRASSPPGPRMRGLMDWLRDGEDGRGGLRWREGRTSRHACSTGAVGVAALRLSGPGGAPTTDDLALARRCRDFLTGPLRLPSGLVADHVDTYGRMEPTVWSYNQGLLVGLEVLLHRHGDEGALERARAHAKLTTEWFTPERLHTQPPCFVAVMLRMLLLLSSADGDPRWGEVADAYLDRVWATARVTWGRPEGGWRGGDIGRYGEEVALDLGGLLQVTALRAGDPATYAAIC